MIPQLPRVRDLDEFTRLTNDRLRRIASELDLRYKRGQDLDLAGFRIKNPGDPIDPNDAISRAAADRRYLTPRTVVQNGSTVVAAGTAGTAIVTFSPALYEYGTFSVESVAITGATGIGTFKGLTVVPVYVDEMDTENYVTIDSASGTTDPLTIAVTQHGAPSHAIGDWVVFNDAGHYEIAQITGISGLNYTLKRSWPGDAAPNAIFSSTREDHASGTALFRAITAKFPFAPAAADYDAGSDTITVPDTITCTLPNACVVAILVSAQFGEDTGPWTVANTALATVPGLRTLSGGNYAWTMPGTVAVNQTTTPKRAQYEASIRVAFARAGTAPTGAALSVNFERSTNNGGTWANIATVAIAAGAADSFDFATAPPGPRRTPYSGSWPFPLVRPDDLLRVKVTAVGSSTAGANLSLELHT